MTETERVMHHIHIDENQKNKISKTQQEADWTSWHSEFSIVSPLCVCMHEGATLRQLLLCLFKEI